MNPWPGATGVDSKQRAFTLPPRASSRARRPSPVSCSKRRLASSSRGGGALELVSPVPAGKRAMSGENSRAARASRSASASGRRARPEMPRYVAWKILRSGSDRAARRRLVRGRARAERPRPRSGAQAGRHPVRAAARRCKRCSITSRPGSPPSSPRTCTSRWCRSSSSIASLSTPCARPPATPCADASTFEGAHRERDARRRVRRCARHARSGDPRRDLELRNGLREPVFHDPNEHPLLWAEEALSMPVALIKRWSARFGEARATTWRAPRSRSRRCRCASCAATRGSPPNSRLSKS